MASLTGSHEEEWEYAARNGDKEISIRGETPGRRVMPRRSMPASERSNPSELYPAGANRWGVQDLMGNVWDGPRPKHPSIKGNTCNSRAYRIDRCRGGGYVAQRIRLWPLTATGLP